MFLTHRYVGEDDSLPDVGFGVFFNVYHYYRKNIYQDGYYAHLSNRPRIRKDIVSKHRILKVTFVLFERMAIAEFRLWQVPHEI